MNVEHYNAQAGKQMMTSAIAQAVYETNKHRRNESQKDIYSSICKSLMTFCAAAATTLNNKSSPSSLNVIVVCFKI